MLAVSIINAILGLDTVYVDARNKGLLVVSHAYKLVWSPSEMCPSGLVYQASISQHEDYLQDIHLLASSTGRLSQAVSIRHHIDCDPRGDASDWLTIQSQIGNFE